MKNLEIVQEYYEITGASHTGSLQHWPDDQEVRDSPSPDLHSIRRSWERLCKDVEAEEEEIRELRERADRKERELRKLKEDMLRSLGGEG